MEEINHHFLTLLYQLDMGPMMLSKSDSSSDTNISWLMNLSVNGSDNEPENVKGRRKQLNKGKNQPSTLEHNKINF